MTSIPLASDEGDMFHAITGVFFADLAITNDHVSRRASQTGEYPDLHGDTY